MLSDEKYMTRAIELATQAGSAVMPNPLVGAVIVHNGQIIGEGYHMCYGEAHAEVNAVNDVKDKSVLSEATIYVTLEPCAHFGKTPPCADLLVHHRFKRVVIGNRDPFDQVNGAGIERLRNAGIEVTVGVCEMECREMNKRFFTFQEKKRPYVVLKWAESKDGFIDKLRTTSQATVNRITGPNAQRMVHMQRAKEHAILVGWKTVAADNPSLTVRLVKGNNPLRIVLDSKLQAPSDSTLFNDGLPTVVFNGIKSGVEGAVEYVKLPDMEVSTILNALYDRKILSVYVEGGAQVHQSFLNSGNWDEIHRFIGPIKFGKGVSAPTTPYSPISSIQIAEDEYLFYRKITE
jgi:diaminohydroxyphosphoribosylaminopyrimidine deaminase / 5-amino-6-(5-phosphoribosylamino)uracil reductase